MVQRNKPKVGMNLSCFIGRSIDLRRAKTASWKQTKNGGQKTMATYKMNGLEVSNGNTKLGPDTIILNMGSGTDCPSKALGLCRVPDGKCYALKAEKMYPTVLPCRNRQSAYWLNSTADTIMKDLDNLFSRFKALRGRIRYLRFNEAGDFYSQSCVNKLSAVASYLKKVYGIVTYGYTAREDLDFTKATFLVKGSGHNNGNHGYTRVITDRSQRKAGEVICPGSCKTCRACKVSKALNVCFLLH